jgi:hypothetical protein
MIVVATICTGAILAFHAWKQGNKEGFLLIATVTIIGLALLSTFPFRKWFWRLLLMAFIPMAIILSYATSVGKLKREPLAILPIVILMVPLFTASIATAEMMKPLITKEGYRELEAMKAIIPPDSVIVAPPVGLRYWIQYVTKCEVSKRLAPNLWLEYEHVLLIAKKTRKFPRLPPRARILYNGKIFILASLPPPRNF